MIWFFAFRKGELKISPKGGEKVGRLLAYDKGKLLKQRSAKNWFLGAFH